VPDLSPPNPGDVVRIRDERWRVVGRVVHGATVEVHVVGLAASNRGRRVHFLLPFEHCDPLPLDAHPKRVRHTEWQRVARRILADATPSWRSLRSVARARLRVIPFQLEPAMALVRGAACRFLIADAVGLGKTIQAGVMITETLERTLDGRVLVVAPAGLRDQWVSELTQRFALEPALLDAAAIPGIVRASHSGGNPWAAMPLVVTSIDYVKRPDVIRSLEGLVWDLIVFDEAHLLAGRSDRRTAAAALAARARAVVMLSATPHSGDAGAFDRLRTLGDLNGEFPLVTFRRGREELGQIPRRRIRHFRVSPTADERAMHDSLASYARLVWRDTDAAGAHLAVSVLLRRAASSAASLATSVERRLALLRADDCAERSLDAWLPFGEPLEDDQIADSELSTPGLNDRSGELEWLMQIRALANKAAIRESKIALLARLLARVNDTAIVFTHYRDTLTTLAGSLPAGSAMLHGGLSSFERRQQVRRFTHGDARLLLATDAASEGLNLHHRCRLVIHLEVPWTPSRVEQRTGRVDRLGQTRPVHSIHLLAAGTSEMDVAATLSVRHERAESALAAAAPGMTATGIAMRFPSTPSDDAIVPVAGTLQHPLLDPVSLASECERIALARELGERAADLAPARPRITLAKHRGFAFQLWALRLPFVDGNGSVFWESLLALIASGRTVSPVERLTGTQAGQRALQQCVREELTRLRNTLAPAIDSMIRREDAIAQELSARRARLSATLLQRGLFEHRADRLASAQDAVLRAALDRSAARRSILAKLGSIGPAEPIAAFGITAAP
jgi:superfamily II DNA or RNA helicase